MVQLSAPPTFKAFNLALIQLGVTANKATNLRHAREMILKAATSDGGSKPKPNVIVLPVGINYNFYYTCPLIICQECFNSPYGHVHFPVYAEAIAYTPGERYDVSMSQSDSVKMLSAAAKEAGAWIIGGYRVYLVLKPITKRK